MRNYKRNMDSISEEDQERIADKIHDKYKVTDQESYDEAFNDYLNDQSWIDKKYKDKTFNKLLTSKNIPLTQRRQIAINTKLSKGQKPRRKLIKGKYEEKSKKKYNYNVLAKSKGKTVFARRIKVDYDKKIVKKTKLKSGATVKKTVFKKSSRFVYVDRNGKRVKKI